MPQITLQLNSVNLYCTRSKSYPLLSKFPSSTGHKTTLNKKTMQLRVVHSQNLNVNERTTPCAPLMLNDMK